MRSLSTILTSAALLATMPFALAQERPATDLADPPSKPIKIKDTGPVRFPTQDLHKIFERSLKDFDGKALRSSADLISRASTVVSNLAGRFPIREDRKMLKQDAKALRTLAAMVKDALTKGSKDLTQQFSETHHLLALHYIASTEGVTSRAIGNLLLGAAHHAEQAASIAGEQLPEANKTELQSIRKLAGEVIKGGKVKSDRIDSSITTLAQICMSNRAQRLGNKP